MPARLLRVVERESLTMCWFRIAAGLRRAGELSDAKIASARLASGRRLASLTARQPDHGRRVRRQPACLRHPTLCVACDHAHPDSKSKPAQLAPPIVAHPTLSLMPSSAGAVAGWPLCTQEGEPDVACSRDCHAPDPGSEIERLFPHPVIRRGEHS